MKPENPNLFGRERSVQKIGALHRSPTLKSPWRSPETKPKRNQPINPENHQKSKTNAKREIEPLNQRKGGTKTLTQERERESYREKSLFSLYQRVFGKYIEGRRRK